MGVLTNEYLFAEYDEILQLSDSVSVIKARRNGRLYVKKTVDAGCMGIYASISNVNIRGVPRIAWIDWENNIAVYEYIEGITVREYIENNGAMPRPLAQKYISELCAILTALHSMGIIHRDISPSNIIISPYGECFLIDFGIARHIKANKAKDTTILGTVGFAPPEQFGFRQTDERSDIYSAGALFNYMITGRMPDKMDIEDPVDAVQTTDYNGKPAIVVNFNYKNNSSSANMFATSVVYNAYQNGVGLSPTVILNGTYDAQLSMKNIQPGAELKVQAAYALSDNSPVTVEVTPIINLNNTKLTKVFDIDR